MATVLAGQERSTSRERRKIAKDKDVVSFDHRRPVCQLAKKESTGLRFFCFTVTVDVYLGYLLYSWQSRTGSR